MRGTQRVPTDAEQVLDDAVDGRETLQLAGGLEAPDALVQIRRPRATVALGARASSASLSGGPSHAEGRSSPSIEGPLVPRLGGGDLCLLSPSDVSNHGRDSARVCQLDSAQLPLNLTMPSPLPGYIGNR